MINQKKLGKFLDKWGSIVIFSVMILAFCVMADNLSDTTEARQRIVDISSVVYENISK